MSAEDYVKTCRWFEENLAQFVAPARDDDFPAHWLCYDGSFFTLAKIEECPDFAAVQALVLGEVGVAA